MPYGRNYSRINYSPYRVARLKVWRSGTCFLCGATAVCMVGVRGYCKTHRGEAIRCRQVMARHRIEPKWSSIEQQNREYDAEQKRILQLKQAGTRVNMQRKDVTA